MKKFLVIARDGREFRVYAATRRGAEWKIIQATFGRVDIVRVQEIY